MGLQQESHPAILEAEFAALTRLHRPFELDLPAAGRRGPLRRHRERSGKQGERAKPAPHRR